MSEKFILVKEALIIEAYGAKESAHRLMSMFADAHTVLETEGRDAAKGLTIPVYNLLMVLNGRHPGDPDIWVWNPKGFLSEPAFNELNLRRKLLSNAIGILTSNGTVRHDLNEI